MKITDLASLKQFFRESVETPIFGVGVYAFDRLGLEGIVPDYRLLALRHSLDTQLIEKDIEIFSLEKGMGTKHINEPRNSTTVLKDPRVKNYLSEFNRPALIVYKTSSRMERICQGNNWVLIGTPVKFGKALFEDKVKFRRILGGLAVPTPPGDIIPVKNLDFTIAEKKYGLPFVLQHPRRGGGKGTFFIHSKEDWSNALGRLYVHEREGETIQDDVSNLEVIIAKYITGPSPSITACVTRHGILSTSLQYQLVDIPELYSQRKGSGLFCGHDWTSSRFQEDIEKQAYDIVAKVGKYFAALGYRGIFGIDFILDETGQKLFVTECNPRLLGSFPVVLMAQARNNEPPILAFHLLEYLGIEYNMDLDRINTLLRQPKEGAQMFLHNLTDSWVKNHNEVRAGVYKLKLDKLEFIRPGYALKHLRGNDEFLLTDGILQKKSHYSPNRRLARIITLRAVLAQDKKSLTQWAKQIAVATHSAFNLKKVYFAKFVKLLKPDFLVKG